LPDGKWRGENEWSRRESDQIKIKIKIKREDNITVVAESRSVI